MPEARSSSLPLSHIWLPAIPLMPLILGTVFLRSLVDPRERLAFLRIYPGDYLEKTIREFIHLGDMLTYLSFVSVHVVVCVGVVVYLIHLMRKLPSLALRRAVLFTSIVTVLLVGLVFVFERKADELVIVQLGYKAICTALETANLSTNLASACFGDAAITKLTLLAWVPAFAGMIAVAFAAGFAYGNAAGLPALANAEWRTVFDQRVKGLQKGLYALSMVLVSSTIAITIFAHFPAGLVKNGSGLATAISKYSSGLSTFWGALFSLTLAATFAAPAYLLLRQAYGQQAAAEDGVDLGAWLHEHVFVSIRNQLVNVASLLAPLLVGPLSSLLASFQQ